MNKPLRCWLGWHDWMFILVSVNPPYAYNQCAHCDKVRAIPPMGDPC